MLAQQSGARRLEFNFGKLFPRVGFIVIKLEIDSRAVMRFSNMESLGMEK
jgi:hypothetical protein